MALLAMLSILCADPCQRVFSTKQTFVAPAVVSPEHSLNYYPPTLFYGRPDSSQLQLTQALDLLRQALDADRERDARLDSLLAGQPSQFAATARPSKSGEAVFAKHCLGCHNSGKHDFSRLTRELAIDCAMQVSLQQMPPPSEEQLVDDDYRSLLGYFSRVAKEAKEVK